jgi:rhodanese-related sulfurtransferase
MASTTTHGVHEITRQGLQSKLDKKAPVTLVEALSPEEFRKQHLPRAVNIPMEQVAALAPRLLPDKDREIVVYCSGKTCHSSDTVAQKLMDLGYTNVDHYAGGKSEWVANGLPIEHS